MNNINILKHTRISLTSLDILVFTCLTLFACWTLAYHFVLLTRYPAISIIVFFFVLVVVAIIFLFNSRNLVSISCFDSSYYVLSCLLIISLLASIMSVVILRPDADDLAFFHRALVQINNMRSPVFINDTVHNLPGLPLISSSHIMTSYEYLTAFISYFTGIKPILIYHNIMSFAISFLVPIVYYLLYKTFGLSSEHALVAVFATSVFLLLEGNQHQSFGNMAFVRLWQGKTILFTLLIPLTLLLTYRFLNSQSMFTLIGIVMCSISAVGLSGSGIFMIPILVFCATLAYTLNEILINSKLPYGKMTIRNAFLCLAIIYCLVPAIGIYSGIIPMPKDTAVWQSGWRENWWDNLQLVLGDTKSVIRNILIIFFLPWIIFESEKAKFIILYSLVLIMVCFNPLFGPIFMNILLPGAYWRLAYLLPVPFCAGLISRAINLLSLSNLTTENLNTKLRIIIVSITLISFVLAFHNSTISPSMVKYKMPLEYKFDRNILSFSLAVSDMLENRNLLAVEDIANVLPLLNSSIKLEASSIGYTKHIFSNAGKEEEGERRVRSQSFITTGKCLPLLEEAFRQSIEEGVDSIIVRNDVKNAITEYLLKISKGWKVIYQDDYFTLIMKNDI